MTCEEAREQLSALLDGGLTPDDRAACQLHLDGCRECAREWERFTRTVALLRGLEPVRAPVGFVDRVLQAAWPTPWYRRLVRRLFIPLPVKLPLEAAALLLVALGAVYLLQRVPEQRYEVRDGTTRQESPAAVGSASREPSRPVGSSTSTHEASRAQPSTGGQAVQREASRPDSGRSTETPASASLQRREATNSPTAPTEREEVAPSQRVPPAALPAAPTAPAPVASPPASEKRRLAFGKAPSPESPRELAPQGALLGRGLGGRSSQSARLEAQQQGRAMVSKPSEPGEVGGNTPPTTSARLVVQNPEAALLAVVDVVKRLGGTVVSQRVNDSQAIVEAKLPGSAYPALVRELSRLGAWSAGDVESSRPETLLLSIRITQ